MKVILAAMDNKPTKAMTIGTALSGLCLDLYSEVSVNKDLERAWAEAQDNPGKPVDIGRIVVCDGCDEDFTDSTATGGMIFGSRAICPTCEPKWRKSMTEYGEQHMVRATCQADQAFADFVREYRGPNTKICINPGRS